MEKLTRMLKKKKSKLTHDLDIHRETMYEAIVKTY